jgi:hypothetical protein
MGGGGRHTDRWRDRNGYIEKQQGDLIAYFFFRMRRVGQKEKKLFAY